GWRQGDGAGAIGGAGGEGKAVPYFMVRIRLVNGAIRSQQLRAVASLSERYARGSADITVRQNIQLHWVAIEDLSDVLETLFDAGLTSMSTCADVTRTITRCPFAGLEAHELCDASPLISQVTDLLVGSGDSYTLPRQCNISTTG